MVLALAPHKNLSSPLKLSPARAETPLVVYFDWGTEASHAVCWLM